MAVLVVTLFISWRIHGKIPDSLMTSFSSFTSLIGAGAAMSSNHKKALRLAKDNMDARLTGYFIEALSSQDREIVALARETLGERLNHLTPEEYQELREDQRERLGQSIAAFHDANYLRSAVSAVSRCGGKEMLKPLETASSHALPKKGRSDFQKVQTEAKLALADIRMRVAKGIIAQTELETATLHRMVQAELPETATAHQEA